MKFIGLLITLSLLLCMKQAHSWSYVLGGIILPLSVRPCSNMSRLKLSTSMVVWLGCCNVIL